MNSQVKVLIVFAWAMETVGVGSGVINSAYTTFGEHLPDTLIGFVPALPMVALAVAEFGRVPLASAIYQKRKLVQALAAIGIIALGYLAVENWTFGFERIVDLRHKAVTIAKSERADADATLSSLLEQKRQLVTRDQQKRDELRQALAQRDTSIADLTSQLSKEADVHQKNLEEIREACRIIRGKCIIPRSQDEDLRYSSEVKQLSENLARLRAERNQLQSQVDGLISTDAENATRITKDISAAQVAVNAARQAERRAVDGNQIYRLAASWYRVSTSEVTPEQFAAARWVFATFGAVAVAFAGSVAALVYYAPDRLPGRPSIFGNLLTKVTRARRAYYARKRKPIVREIPGPERLVYRDGKEPAVIVEKEVPRFIDQIVLIPRWGITAPTHINALLRSNRKLGASGKRNNSPKTPSNVTPLNKKVG